MNKTLVSLNSKPAWVLVVRENVSNYERNILAQEKEMHSSSDVAELLGPRLGQEEVEVMVVIALDGHNHVKHLAEVSRGGFHGCAVSAKEILRVALIAGASGFILVHNHPSGDPTPSSEDIIMTKTINRASQVVGCFLQDHIILAGTRHVSMLDLGLI